LILENLNPNGKMKLQLKGYRFENLAEFFFVEDKNDLNGVGYLPIDADPAEI